MEHGFSFKEKRQRVICRGPGYKSSYEHGSLQVRVGVNPTKNYLGFFRDDVQQKYQTHWKGSNCLNNED
jgi:hypothetical protein